MNPNQRKTVQCDPPSSLLYDMRATMLEERRARRRDRLYAVVSAYVFMGATAGMVALVLEMVRRVK
jgi:hypothetical protein